MRAIFRVRFRWRSNAASKSSSPCPVCPALGPQLDIGGEASTAYLARQQLLYDPTMAVLQASAADEPKPVELSVAAAAAAGPLRGRAAYPRARTLRTKPGRPDSPIAHSLSCSDKIARHGALGIQGALLADLLEPVWLSGVVLGPVSADEDREKLAAEASEALSGRVLRELEDERFRGKPLCRIVSLAHGRTHCNPSASVSARSLCDAAYCQGPPLRQHLRTFASGASYDTFASALAFL
jgi:hypothetical protein